MLQSIFKNISQKCLYKINRINIKLLLALFNLRENYGQDISIIKLIKIITNL